MTRAWTAVDRAAAWDEAPSASLTATPAQAGPIDLPAAWASTWAELPPAVSSVIPEAWDAAVFSPSHTATAGPATSAPMAALSGKVVTYIGGNEASSVATDLVVLGNGKIVLVGSSTDGAGDSSFAVVRFGSSGSLDTGFSGDGRAVTSFGSGHDQAAAVAPQADGKLVVAGGGGGADGHDVLALARYKSNGALDTGWSGDGLVMRDISGSTLTGDQASDVAVLANGQMLVSGVFDLAFGVARLKSGGGLDTAFGNGGSVSLSFGAAHAAAYAMVVQPDGKIVLVGEVIPDGPLDGSRNVAVARFNANGTLDTSFSGDGKLSFGFGGVDAASSVVLQADGKILVAGRSDDHIALARLNSNGAFDNSFGGDGKVETSVGADASASSITLQANGRILVAGQTTGDAGADFALLRYKADGGLDTSFGTGGRVITDFGADDRASAVAVQADGRIVVGGASGDGFALARYLADGSLDTGFGAPAVAADLLFG